MRLAVSGHSAMVDGWRPQVSMGCSASSEYGDWIPKAIIHIYRHTVCTLYKTTRQRLDLFHDLVSEVT